MLKQSHILWTICIKAECIKRCAVLGAKPVQRCCWAWARPWRPRWRPWSRSCSRSRLTPTSSSGRNPKKSSVLIANTLQHFVVCCCQIWVNCVVLNWLHTKHRSDANTALDVLAENLSVYKVGRALLVSYWLEIGRLWQSTKSKTKKRNSTFHKGLCRFLRGEVKCLFVL